MRLGVAVRPPLRRRAAEANGPSGLDLVVGLARAAEDAGYDALFLDGRAAPVEDAAGEPLARVDPYVVLGAVAVSTSALQLGCLAPTLDDRPPSLLAKVVTALDACSDGRAVLALGLGDLPADESELERLGEGLEVCRALLRVPSPSFVGRHYHLERAFNEPRPVPRESGLPIAVAVPADASAFAVAGVLELATRLAELCVLEVRSSDAAAARVRAVREELTPFARRAGRVDGGPGLLVRLPVSRLEPPAVAERVERCLAAGADGVVLDWAAEGVGPDDLAAVGKLVAAESS
ncbi:MAG TPA: LLM class flavin-dependent oxidoreductase [Acidimicrobiales bacterium]|nr:LLM class flavin-dependent oxidoreductase [Acidimicrobiales bacterium]